MEFIIIFILVLTWKWWVYALLSLVRFLPESFFMADSLPKKDRTAKPRKQYTDTISDITENLQESNKFTVNQFMSAEQKAKYLQSQKWKEKRQLVLQRDNYTCKSCGIKHSLEVHHVRYDNLGNEPIRDLVVLCSSCHNRLHEKLGYDRKTTFNFSTLK